MVSLTIEGERYSLSTAIQALKKGKRLGQPLKMQKILLQLHFGTFSTGVNIRNINNIVLASPSKSKI